MSDSRKTWSLSPKLGLSEGRGRPHRGQPQRSAPEAPGQGAGPLALWLASLRPANPETFWDRF